MLLHWVGQSHDYDSACEVIRKYMGKLTDTEP